MPYKVAYHVGKQLDLNTKVESGRLFLDNEGFSIRGSGPDVRVPFARMESVRLFRLHGLGRMIEVVCHDRTLFLTVIRLNFFGYFLIINFFGAGDLHKRLEAGLLRAKGQTD